MRHAAVVEKEILDRLLRHALPAGCSNSARYLTRAAVAQKAYNNGRLMLAGLALVGAVAATTFPSLGHAQPPGGLEGIERALNPGKEFKGNDAVHIEHVMPQTPNDDWKECLGETMTDHPAYVQRWGNLTLLHAPLNQEASNYSFADKQARYEKSEVTITRDLTGYLR